MDMERQMKKWERQIEWIKEDNHKMRQRMGKMHDAMHEIVKIWLGVRYYQGIDDTLEG
jgi:hypothetical protein